MGHTRLGRLPKTQKWLDLVERIAGSRVSGVLSAAPYVESIAAQTLDASRAGLDNAKHDSGVLYAFYLLMNLYVYRTFPPTVKRCRTTRNDQWRMSERHVANRWRKKGLL